MRLYVIPMSPNVRRVRRGFSCCDLEGHLSSFGTYDPWDVQPSTSADAPKAT